MILSRDVLVGVLIALFIAGGVGGFNYWKKYREKKLDEVATLVYLYEKGELDREQVEERIKGSPYYPYFLALVGEKPSEIARFLKDGDLRSLFLEKEAYLLYSKKKYRDSIALLERVKKEYFNYPSALLLRAFNFEATGENEKALKIYEELSRYYGETYFGRIAIGRMLSLRGISRR